MEQRSRRTAADVQWTLVRRERELTAVPFLRRLADKSSALSSIRTLCTWRQGPTTTRAGCGTCNAERAFDCFWDIPTQSPACPSVPMAAHLPVQVSRCASLCFLSLLTKAGLDSSIWLWDLGSSRPIKTMKGHRGPIHTLSWSAESSVLVSGGADCTVRCWDTKSAGGARRGSVIGGASGAGGGGGATAVGSTISGAAGALLAGGGTDGPAGHALMGTERGGLPMGPGEMQRDDQNAT